MIKKFVHSTVGLFGYSLARRRTATAQFAHDEIAFLHIGKNAGTQIMHCCRQLEPHGVHVVKLPHGVKKAQLPPGVRYFFSIRDPTSRFTSGFYSRKRQGLPRTFSPWTDDEAIAFTRFEHANDLAESLWLENDRGANAAMAIKSISHTGAQQFDWFERSAFLDRDGPIWIIRQEFFEEDFAEFLDRVGTSLRIADISITTDPTASHQNDYSGTPQLSDRARANLRRWYAQDYYFYDMCERWMERNR